MADEPQDGDSRQNAKVDAEMYAAGAVTFFLCILAALTATFGVWWVEVSILTLACIGCLLLGRRAGRRAIHNGGGPDGR